MTITATYSPEDNKLRLYPSRRLDAETFERVKAAGFKWAPRQELFVAPKWTPAREDLAAELAGEIEPEEMTLAERATLKAERLDALAAKRHAQSQSLFVRADLSEDATGIPFGQPILVGHHSERKHRKVIERANRAMGAAVKAGEAANYWLYRATGVERFANMKNDPRTRQNRIKGLLSELRDLQRAINDAHNAIELWEQFTTPDRIMWAICNLNGDTLGIPWGTYSKREEVDTAALRTQCLARLQVTIEGPTRRRWIDHILSRLAFERSMLGDVPRYDGEITPVILQAFAREHGAEKPKASETDPGAFEVSSPVPLPLHIATGCTLDLDADDWRDLMQSVGYIVPAPVARRTSSKPAAAPLVNPTAEQAEHLQRVWNLRMVAECKAKGRAELAESNTVKALTQATYSSNSGGSYSPLETVEIDADGRRIHARSDSFCGRDNRRAPVARIRIYTRGTGFYMPRAVVHISDKPSKALPVDLGAIELAANKAIADAGEPATLGGAAYNPALLIIKRRRPSTSQGEAVLHYNGRMIDLYGDTIRRTESGEYEGFPDDHWHAIAERVLSEAQQVAA